MRLITARLLLECLYDCEEAQAFFCRNVDKSLQFTPLFGSPVALNATVERELLFKDASSIRRFQQHCANVARFKDSKPKCWFYDHRRQLHQDQESTTSVLASLADFNIDPLTVVIGFFSVVGAKAHTIAAKNRETAERPFSSTVEPSPGSFVADPRLALK